jgi:hypothetical protein
MRARGFLRLKTQRDGSGGAPTTGPRTSSSAVSARALMRLAVNQFESGTSSMVLRFCARVPDGL